MIDPLGVPILFNLVGIDPPGVPVKPLFKNRLTRQTYTFLELPFYPLALSVIMASVLEDRAKARKRQETSDYLMLQKWKEWIKPGMGVSTTDA